MNALIILMLSKEVIANKNKSRITVAFVAVAGFIFAVTFFFAKLSLKLQKPVKLAMGCSVQAEMREKEKKGEKRIINENLLHKGKLKRQMQNKTCKWPLSDRLKLYRYIETFHTKRQFTVQYGL